MSLKACSSLYGAFFSLLLDLSLSFSGLGLSLGLLPVLMTGGYSLLVSCVWCLGFAVDSGPSDVEFIYSQLDLRSNL